MMLKKIARLRVPLGFVFGVLAIWLADPTPRTLVIGAIVAIAGEAIRIWAAGHLEKGREVTASGPYAWTRHPLYLGSTLIGIGLAIGAGSILVAAIVLGYLAITLTAAIRTEEAHLTEKFGAAYPEYRAGRHSVQRQFSLERAMRNREYRAAIGVLVVLAVLTAKVFAPGAAAAAVQEAQVFAPGSVSDANEQWRITFTPDGRTAYFAESEKFFPFSRKATIYMSTLRDGRWSPPVVAPFSGTHSDIDPFITPDGQRLYFSSIRPVGGVAKDDIDIWMVEGTARGWSKPVHLGPEVNSGADELYPSASADGTLYFASGPQAPAAGRHYDIYRARRAATGFSPREVLGPAINSTPAATDPGPQAAWDFNPEVSADGTLLVFTSLRPGGHGLGDLYASRFVAGKWTPAVNLGPPVNTAADEYHPTLSRDRSQLYFVRRGSAPGDFFTVPVASIPALSGK